MVPYVLLLPAATQCTAGIESNKILEAQEESQTSTEHIYLGLPGGKRFSLRITAYRREKQLAQEPSILGWGTSRPLGLPHWRLVLSKPAKMHLEEQKVA